MKQCRGCGEYRSIRTESMSGCGDEVPAFSVNYLCTGCAIKVLRAANMLVWEMRKARKPKGIPASRCHGLSEYAH